MRPVVRGLIGYEQLKGTTIDLEDIQRMNDALDVQDENEYRAREAMERQAHGGRGP